MVYHIPTWKRTETSMDLCLSSCSLKVAQMSEADATLTEQATGMVSHWCSSAVSASERLILVRLGPVGSAGACLYHVCNMCPYATVLPLQKYGSL